MNIRSLIIAAFIAFSTFGLVANTAAAGELDQIRTVWVLSDSPQSLTLRFNGRTLGSWDPDWQRTSRGYETQISFQAELAFRYQDMRLIRADGKGWSDWHAEHTQYLRHSNVGRNDPACVGGKGWCSVRGL